MILSLHGLPRRPSSASPLLPHVLARATAEIKITREPTCSIIMDNRKDDLNSFGQGSHCFPKALPDDCVEYTLWIIDTTLQDSEIRQRLRVVQNAAKALTKRLLSDFIWQREGFSLDLVHQDGKVMYPFAC